MKLPFDKVYCLHLAEDKDRYENIQKEFKRLGIEKQVEIYNAISIPNMLNVALTLKNTNLFNWNGNGNGGALSCFLSHYNIIKKSFESDVNSVLIMEDDIMFNENLNLIKKTMKNIPLDYDIIRFSWGDNCIPLDQLDKKKNIC